MQSMNVHEPLLSMRMRMREPREVPIIHDKMDMKRCNQLMRTVWLVMKLVQECNCLKRCRSDDHECEMYASPRIAVAQLKLRKE